MDKIDISKFLFNPNPRLKKEKKSTKVTKGKTTKKSNTVEETADFSEMLEVQETITDSNESPQIEELLKEIGLTGERLKKRRDLVDLEHYKKLVNKLLKEVIDTSIATEHKTLWNKKRKEKVTKVHVTIINKELLELTKIFFDEQKNTLAIITKIDKIEGMLIDMVS